MTFWPRSETYPTYRLPLLLWLAYVAFVVYGALLPFNFQPRPFEQAWLAFSAIPFLQLGVGSRADWIANGVLFVPLATLTAHLALLMLPRCPRALALMGAALFATVLSVGIEFAQVYFPGRTVSLNDILAQGVGTVAGLVLATHYREWYRTLSAMRFGRLNDHLASATGIYAILYLFFAAFPLDFVLSGPELATKIGSPNWGWGVARSSVDGMRVSLQALAEVVAVLPFGMWLAARRKTLRHAIAPVFVWGLLFGLAIECMQFLLYSGISQGISVLARGLGFLAGAFIVSRQSRWQVMQVRHVMRRHSPWMAALYLLFLLYINGWLDGRWNSFSLSQALSNMPSFLPFYYHYFTSEANALFSFVAVCLAYLPVAFFGWVHQRPPWVAAGAAVLVAVVLETGKLFIDGAHPDITNLGLAGASCWVATRLLSLAAPSKANATGPQAPTFEGAELVVSHGGPVPDSGVNAVPVEITSTKSRWQGAFWLAAAIGLAGVWLVTFPVAQTALFLVLGFVGIVVWRQPLFVFAVVPAALPILDLAPWSGRFFIDEFDALLVVAISVAYFRTRLAPRPKASAGWPFAGPTLLVVLSFSVSLVIGLLPVGWTDLNATNNYFSTLNAARIAKGVLWGLLMFGLARRWPSDRSETRQYFGWGMVSGLGLTVVFILWERMAFSGLWNFSATYRVTGPFSAIHTGGASIEAFLVVGVPFLVVLTLGRRNWLLKMAGFALLLACTYALMVTYSRNGYVAYAASLSIVLLAQVLRARKAVASVLAASMVAAASMVVAIPVFSGEFAQARIATIRTDLGTRLNHWNDALAIRDQGWFTQAFGMGLGRFPVTSFWRSSQTPRTGTYRLAEQEGNTFLQLGAGDSLYIEQFVRLKPGGQYKLIFDARPMAPNSSLSLPICEKWLLTSYNCIWSSVQFGKDYGAWRTVELPVDASRMPAYSWYSQRPVKLSLHYADRSALIDIDNIRLEAPNGRSLVKNGDFSSSLDHWFFSADGHLQWHIKNLLVALLFDQGWLGFLAVGALLAMSLAHAARCSLKGDRFAPAGLAALVGFLVIGIFDTLIDTPRFLLLMLLLSWFCAKPCLPLNPVVSVLPKELAP